MSTQPPKPKPPFGWSTLRQPLPMESPKESALSRLIIAPLAFITFLLSLALIDSHNTSLRSSHPPSLLSRIRGFVRGIVYKEREGGPYDYVRSPNAKAGMSSRGKEVRGVVEKGGDREGEKWYWHSQQRHMMRAEFEDAFRLRNSVAVVLIGLVLGVGWFVCLGVGWGWQWVRSWL